MFLMFRVKTMFVWFNKCTNFLKNNSCDNAVIMQKDIPSTAAYVV